MDLIHLRAATLEGACGRTWSERPSRSGDRPRWPSRTVSRCRGGGPMNRQPTMVLAGALIALSGPRPREPGRRRRPRRPPRRHPPRPRPWRARLRRRHADAVVDGTPEEVANRVLAQPQAGHVHDVPGRGHGVRRDGDGSRRAEHHAEVTLRMDLPGRTTGPATPSTPRPRRCARRRSRSTSGGRPTRPAWRSTSSPPRRRGWAEGDHRLICPGFDLDAETTTVALKGSKQ